jgi:hypothetical protein
MAKEAKTLYIGAVKGFRKVRKIIRGKRSPETNNREQES